MKRHFYHLVFIMLVSFNIVEGQINCIAPDSIVEKYKDDADRLALRKIARLHLTYEDSIEIPKILSDSFLNQLIAVYNVVGIPERDTVIDILDIHTFPVFNMKTVFVAADSSLNWMQQLRNGIIPTGYQPLDSIIEKYDLTIDEYYTWYNWFSWHSVYFKSQVNYNIPALASAFETLPEVDFSEPNYVAGDGNNIEDNLIIIGGENYGYDLFYSYGWGDCLAGCTGRRAWWFKTYDDCSVEFVEAYGSSLPFTNTHEQTTNPIHIRPNLFEDVIWIEGTSDLFEYSISDINGRNMVRGKSTERKIANLENLIPGIYILTIREKNSVSSYKIVKI